MPSVCDLIFLALLFSLSIGVLSQKLLGDAGTGWHIRAGEQILATRSIPRSDPFSVSTSGQPWYAWEWLYDVVIAAIHHELGLNGVVLFTAFAIALTFAATLRLTLRRGTMLPVAVFLVLLAAGASTIHFLARPHVLSWFLLIVWFELLDSSEKSGNPRFLYWLPLITLVWVDVHGGFLVGFVLCVLFLLGKAFEHWRSPENRASNAAWMKTLTGATVVSFLVTFVNPYGYHLHVHIFRYLTDRFLMNHVDEFQSPNFHGGAQQCFAALVLIAIATLALAHRKLRAWELLIVVFAVYSGMYASRNLPASSILLVLIIGPTLSNAISTGAMERMKVLSRFRTFSVRMTFMESRLRGNLWPVVGTLALLVICFQHGRLGSRQLINAQFSSKRFPVNAVDYLQQHKPGVPIFATDYWGGYLLYRLYPENKVLVDDRHDLYGDAFLKRYLGVIHVVPGWDKVLDDLHVKLVVLPTESSLTSCLKEVHQWRIEYQDSTATVFRR